MMLSGGDPLRHSLQEAVGGQYEIIRLLGRGGMGAVYLAGDTLERLVAIKVILPAAFADRRMRDLFRREMRTVAQFDHPNIVQIHSSGGCDDLDWFVMKYVSGDTLADRLEREPLMPPKETRRILVDLADALHYAHGHGVVHRDVKPANILIDDMTGRAYLTDFGVAKSLNSVTTNSKQTVAGTAGYMPPEAFSGGEIDRRADIYAVGVVGYEMLAGRRPFSGETPLQVIQQTLMAAPRPLSQFVDVEPDLAGVVMRCLEKNPADRPRSAGHLKTMLGIVEVDELNMPSDLSDMAGFGSWTLLWVSVWATFAILKLDQLMLGVPLLVIALIVPTGFLLQVASIRPAGFPLRQIARVAFWPPKWWGMWWPRQLRRPVDLWPRLPLRARLTRVALSTFLIVVPLLIFLATPTGTGPAVLELSLPLLCGGSPNPRPCSGAGVWLIIGVLAAALAAILIEAGVWAHRMKLQGREIVRMLIGPTVVSQLWDSPKVAMLLGKVMLPIASDVHEEPKYVRECHHKIRRVAQSLIERSAVSARLALVADRQLLGQIEALDLEILELVHLNDPEAIARLEAGLDEANLPAHDSALAALHRRSRESELAQLRDIERRFEAAQRDRGRLAALQRAIWRELVALADLEPGDRGAERIIARLQRLCEGRDDPGDEMSPAGAPS